jgi:hypothetical protein
MARCVCGHEEKWHVLDDSVDDPGTETWCQACDGPNQCTFTPDIERDYYQPLTDEQLAQECGQPYWPQPDTEVSQQSVSRRDVSEFECVKVMDDLVEPKDGFFNRLDELSARADKLPEWKKRGWALLDFDDDPPNKPADHPDLVSEGFCDRKDCMEVELSRDKWASWFHYTSELLGVENTQKAVEDEIHKLQAQSTAIDDFVERVRCELVEFSSDSTMRNFDQAVQFVAEEMKKNG